MARRRVMLLVICVLLGAILNVAVAWSCAIWSGLDPASETLDVPREEAIRVLDAYAPPEARVQRGGKFESRGFGITQIAIFRDGSPEGNVIERKYGVPMHCLCLGMWIPGSGWPSDRTTQVTAGFWLSPAPGAILSSRRVIPTGPLWPGFIVNTIFFAAIVWMLMRGPAETRRRWREFKGCCGACGYPRGTSPVCTECGANLSRAWFTRRV